MDENHSSIPSASEKQSYKFLLDAALARKREREMNLHAEEQEVLLVEITEEVEEEIQQEIPEELLDNETSDDEPLPGIELSPRGVPTEKNYFRIGEVGDLLGVEPHVLRYWESEFSQVRPTKSGGQRVYNRKTVETLSEIRHLLYDKGFSISGARKQLKQGRLEKKSAPLPEPTIAREELLALEKGLRELIRFAETNTAF